MRRQSDDWDAPAPGAALGQRVTRFVALLGVVFAITAAIIVTRRLSQDSLALLIGLSCGVMTVMPTLGLAFIVVRREDAQRRQESHHDQAQRQFGYTGSPPVIVVAPQAMPGDYRTALGAPNPAGSWMPQQSQRTFTIVGDEE
jgi:hypothetical protein